MDVIRRACELISEPGVESRGEAVGLALRLIEAQCNGGGGPVLAVHMNQLSEYTDRIEEAFNNK